ncbi:isoamylase [Ranunculus cassubicifolius]
MKLPHIAPHSILSPQFSIKFPPNRTQIHNSIPKIRSIQFPINASNNKLIITSTSIDATASETAVIEKLKPTKFEVFEGNPLPFGATAKNDGVNFAIHSSGAVSATLCLISLEDLDENRVTTKISLDPKTNKTGDVWHVFLRGDFENMLYGYIFDGKFFPEEGHCYDSSTILLDPYAKAVISREEFGALGPKGNCWPQMAGMVPSSDNEELGVNCIELMPFQEYNELEYFSYNSVLGNYKLNFWGYSTVNYFSPMLRYSSAGVRNCGQDAINEVKILVREAHKRGIEVLMDVVFNHTAEGNEKGPTLSFRGVDNSVYYMLAPKGEYYNYSGCGNTFNCNHPVVRQFILDCLRYWVEEMHVDGFRFDLASILTRSSSLWDAANVYGSPVEGDLLSTGTPLGSPPLIDMISNDPILRRVKLIAEAWDTGGLYQVGVFPHWGVWSEWNGKYRDIVRQFIKGTDGFSGAFAECLCGSPTLYKGGGRKPWNSINFVCAHDGFTLADLVTYNNKHNLANGEDNNDGENHNNSWNCGQEGEFASLSVRRLRKRQMRNFFLCLMVSQGVPMFYMGDEYGHSKGGNNNTYCHDNYVNYFRWDEKDESKTELYRFCCLLTKFRKECESLGLDDFPTADRLQWHGHTPGLPDWSESSRFVAFSLIDSVKGEIYIAFNTSHLAVTISLPDRPGYRWEPFVDTSKPAPYDFLSNDVPGKAVAIKQYSHFLDANMYPMLSYSSIILLLAPDDNV